jgi:valyl-tRNA synthetase
LDHSNLGEHLAIAKWPQPSPGEPLGEAEGAAMEQCIATTQAINSLRSLVGHHPGSRVRAILRILPSGNFGDFEGWKGYAMTLARLSEIGLGRISEARPSGMVFAPLSWGEAAIEAPAAFDFDKARAMLKKKLEEVQVDLQRNQRRYQNPDFRAKADDETVSETADRIEELKARESLLQTQIGLIQ